MQLYFVLLLVASASALHHTTLTKQVVPKVYSHVVPQVQVMPQVYSQVAPQVQVVPQDYSQVVPQAYSQVIPQVYSTNQVYTQQYQQVKAPVVQAPVFRSPIVMTQQQPQYMRTLQTVQAPVQTLTPGYVAANHGALHTAPLPEGPSNDGFHASHHINLPNQKA